MTVRDRDWVSILDASASAKVPATTIRDAQMVLPPAARVALHLGK